MVLELIGADFSKNNIGKIDIPTAVVTSIVISGEESVTGESANYLCTATYDDGMSRDVTSQASWSVNSSYATINKGVLTISDSALETQNVTITVAFGGKSNSFNVSIKYQDVSDATIALLSAYGNKSITKTQRKAVNEFLTSIKTATYRSKIKQLFIPILAERLEKALVDVMSYDYAIYKTLTDAEYALDDLGLKNVLATGTDKLILNSEGIKANNFHIISLMKFGSNISTIDVNDFINPLSSDSRFYLQVSKYTSGDTVRWRYDGPTSRIVGTTINTLVGETNFKFINDIVCIGCQGGKLRRGDSTQPIVVDSNDYLTQMSNQDLGTVNLKGYKNQRMVASQSVISIGEGLTDAEYEHYKRLLVDLGTAFNLFA